MDQLVLRRHRADDDRGAPVPDSLQVGDAAEIDQVLRGGHAQFHHRDQAVTTGERTRLVTEVGKEAYSLFDG